MRALIQRVIDASVTINGEENRHLNGAGMVIFIGITHEDNAEFADVLAEKCVNLRIFQDEHQKMNLSLLDTHKRALIVSQFTLYADTQKGRRPAFIQAARPEQAIPLYERFISAVESYGVEVQTGTFGADMLVNIQNDGPVTLMVEYPLEKI